MELYVIAVLLVIITVAIVYQIIKKPRPKKRAPIEFDDGIDPSAAIQGRATKDRESKSG